MNRFIPSTLLYITFLGGLAEQEGRENEKKKKIFFLCYVRSIQIEMIAGDIRLLDWSKAQIFIQFIAE